jgi:hypothetical protein
VTSCWLFRASSAVSGPRARVHTEPAPAYRFGLLANALGRSTCVAREWKPARVAAGIEPLRRIYDLRHAFATFALRAGISTFDLSRYMGASLTMIDLLDELSAGERPRWTLVDATWTPEPPAAASKDNGNISQAGKNLKPSDGLEPPTPSLPWNVSGNRSQPTATVSPV